MRWLLFASALSLAPAASSAAPVLGEGGAAVGQIVKGRLVLDVDPAFDPDDVADALRAKLPSVQVVVSGLQVYVDGVTAEQVIASGAQVQPSPDDLERLLMRVRETGAGEVMDAGRYLEVEIEPTERVLRGKIQKVRRQRYPLVFVELLVTEAPPGAQVVEGDRLIVLPRVRATRGLIDPDDTRSKANVGAWYAQSGDVVRVVLEAREEGDEVWVASLLQRDEGP